LDRRKVTNLEGNYSISGLIPDAYTVEFIDTDGVLRSTQSTNVLVADQTVNLPLALPPVILSSNPEISDSAILLSKSVNKKQVKIGEQLYYALVAENTTAEPLRVDIVDNIPKGFKFTAKSGKIVFSGPDNNFDQSDYANAIKVSSKGSDPIVFDAVDIPVGQKIQIGYILKVGTLAQQRSAVNTAQAFAADTNDIASNIATATVAIVADSVLDQATLIGKVFHDRDGDGSQDSASVSGIKVKSDYFGWNSLHLGGLAGRVSMLDDASKYRKVIRMPFTNKNDFKVTTQQGTVIMVDHRGQVTTAHTGIKRNGLTAQDIRISTRRTRGIPTETPIEENRVPAVATDVLEITIINYGIHEEGIPGVRIATVEGLLIETDGYGRYHLPDVDGIESNRIRWLM